MRATPQDLFSLEICVLSYDQGFDQHNLSVSQRAEKRLGPQGRNKTFKVSESMAWRISFKFRLFSTNKGDWFVLINQSRKSLWSTFCEPHFRTSLMMPHLFSSLNTEPYVLALLLGIIVFLISQNKLHHRGRHRSNGENTDHVTT